MNSLADLSFEEYQTLLGYKPELKDKMQSKIGAKRSGFKYEDVDPKDLPIFMDWRDKDAVTAVKN